MVARSLMTEIDTQSLTTCEVAADGGAISLGGYVMQLVFNAHDRT